MGNPIIKQIQNAVNTVHSWEDENGLPHNESSLNAFLVTHPNYYPTFEPESLGRTLSTTNSQKSTEGGASSSGQRK